MAKMKVLNYVPSLDVKDFGLGALINWKLGALINWKRAPLLSPPDAVDLVGCF